MEKIMSFHPQTLERFVLLPMTFRMQYATSEHLPPIPFQRLICSDLTFAKMLFAIPELIVKCIHSLFEKS